MRCAGLLRCFGRRVFDTQIILSAGDPRLRLKWVQRIPFGGKLPVDTRSDDRRAVNVGWVGRKRQRHWWRPATISLFVIE